MKFPPFLPALAHRLTFLAVLLASALLPTMGQGAPVEFTVAEGYLNDTLGGQPFTNPQWAVIGGTLSFFVDSGGPGRVMVQTNQSATQNAVWQSPLNIVGLSNLSNSVDIQFEQNPTPSSATLLGLNYFVNSTSGNSNIYGFFGRDSTVDRYRIGFYQNNGYPATYATTLVSGTLIGLNSASSDNTSDPLRLTYFLTRGANANSWQASVTLKNLSTGVVVATTTIPSFTTSASFYADQSIFATISSQSMQNGSLSSFDVLTYYPPGGTVPPVLPGLTLTFNDEFETTALDPDNWVPHYCKPSTINNELQAYVPDAFEFSGTTLRIRSDRRSFGGKSYTSGAITSFGRFAQTYGYFEMRAKVAEGRGFWPAFWLLPQSQAWPPEIDIMENLGEDPLKVYQTLHYNDPSLITPSNPTGKTASGVPYSGPDFSYDYHTYAISWRPEALIFYVDGVERSRITSFVPSTPMYILANTAVGGVWPVSPDFTTPFPSRFDIDYIRAYSYDNLPATTPPPVTFGKTTVTPETVSAGGTVTVNSSAVIGNADISRLSIHMLIKNFWGTTQYSDTYQFLDGNTQNTTRAFSFSYSVPTNLPIGLYTVAFTMTDAATSQMTSIGLAARFAVGSPLPALPADPIFPTVPAIDLSALTITDVPGQGAATHALVDNGTGIRIQGNGWKTAAYSYTVTSKTYLEFDISSTAPAEIYGIGLLPTAVYDTNALNAYTFEIAGSQILGKQQYHTYSVVTGGVKRYRIPLGGFYTGAMTRLLFINDMDSAPTGDVTIRNIKIYDIP